MESCSRCSHLAKHLGDQLIELFRCCKHANGICIVQLRLKVTPNLYMSYHVLSSIFGKTLQEAPPTEEEKRHGAWDVSNSCVRVSLLSRWTPVGLFRVHVSLPGCNTSIPINRSGSSVLPPPISLASIQAAKVRVSPVSPAASWVLQQLFTATPVAIKAKSKAQYRVTTLLACLRWFENHVLFNRKGLTCQVGHTHGIKHNKRRVLCEA